MNRCDEILDRNNPRQERFTLLTVSVRINLCLEFQSTVAGPYELGGNIMVEDVLHLTEDRKAKDLVPSTRRQVF